MYSSCFTDVCCDDCNVLGGMVSLFHCVFMVFLWRPKENFSCNGHHSSSICKIFHVLQSMHLCHCKQKVSDPKLIMVYFMILAYYVAMERSSVKYNRLVKSWRGKLLLIYQRWPFVWESLKRNCLDQHQKIIIDTDFWERIIAHFVQSFWPQLLVVSQRDS